jgi:hypothetical protein
MCVETLHKGDNDDDDDDDNNNMLQRVGKCKKCFRFLYAAQMSVLVFFVFLFLVALSGNAM